MSQVDTSDRVEPLLQRASLLIGMERHGEALPLIREALTREPASARIHCFLSLALSQSGEQQAALGAAEEAAALDPADEWAHRLRSCALDGLGRRKEALEAAREAARLAPEGQWALYRLTSCAWDLGEREEARRALARLRQAAPEWDWTWLLSASLARRERRWREAEEHSRRAVRINPNAWQAHHSLGLALLKLGRRREAIEALHAALRLDSTVAEVRGELLQAVRDEVSGGFAAVTVLLALGFLSLSLPGVSKPAVLLGLLALLLVALPISVWWYRRRVAALHPTVAAFYRQRVWGKDPAPARPTEDRPVD